MPVLGIPQCLATFARVAVAAEVATKMATEEVKHTVADQARSLVPVETGALQASIEEVEEGVSASADYATFVEFGTSKMSAEPFMRPAADGAASEGTRIEAGMRAAIQSV